ncbi:MAG: DUF2314 domain-containing protein [Vulcanimicrobiota bacterium]
MIDWKKTEGAQMAQAVREAQATFEEFARQAEFEHFRQWPAFEEAALKAFFDDPSQPDSGEHLFLRMLWTDGRTVRGRLASEPSFESSLHAGQVVEFRVERVSDWFLVSKGRGLGGFTLEFVADHLRGEEFERFAPYVWFVEREVSAQEELEAIPVCRRCGRRDLVVEGYENGLCGVCLHDGEACRCQQCDGPILRFPDTPRLCHQCLQARVDEIPSALEEEIERLCNQGYELAESRQWQQAWMKFAEAYELIPPPLDGREETTWVLTAIGDVAFRSGEYDKAIEVLESALGCPGGSADPFLRLRLGQSLYDSGVRQRGREELAEAYRQGGAELFEDEDERYLRELGLDAGPPSGSEA